jgi:hypothetical protein
LDFFKKDNFLVSASSHGEEEEVVGSFAVEFQKHQDRETGLLKAHSYSILRVVEVLGNKLINLRNPWSIPLNWNGKWSDQSPLWTN